MRYKRKKNHPIQHPTPKNILLDQDMQLETPLLTNSTRLQSHWTFSLWKQDRDGQLVS